MNGLKPIKIPFCAKNAITVSFDPAHRFRFVLLFQFLCGNRQRRPLAISLEIRYSRGTSTYAGGIFS